MYTQRSFLRRVADQLLFTSFEVLMLVFLCGGVVLYSILISIKESSQDVAQLSSFFENDIQKNISNTVSSIAERVTTADVATMILWAIVGAVVYVLFLAVIGILRGAKDTVWSSFRFTHPVGHSRTQFFFFTVMEHLAQFLLVFTFIGYSAVVVNAVFPLVFEQVSLRVDAYSLETLWIAVYIFELVVAVHLWVFLWRLVRGRQWQEG